MYTNPFADSWGNSGSDWLSSVNPPTYGALPSFTHTPHSMLFTFNTTNSSILNGSVTGTNSLIYFYISSNSTSTTVSRRNGEIVSQLEWQQHPIIEVYGKVSRRRTSQWLPLSSDQRRRNMTIGGTTYTWIPRGNAICLHSSEATSGEYARITRDNTSITLQITVNAFNSGFFEPCVLATILFLSGRNID